MSDASPFAKHEVVSRVEVPGEFGSWLLKRPEPGANPSGYTNAFACRITAADRVLTVVGDFEPAVFKYGHEHPIACVRWMGSGKGVSEYVAEKAKTGIGHSRYRKQSTELAIQALNRLVELLDAEDAAKAAAAEVPS